MYAALDNMLGHLHESLQVAQRIHALVQNSLQRGGVKAVRSGGLVALSPVEI